MDPLPFFEVRKKRGGLKNLWDEKQMGNLKANPLWTKRNHNIRYVPHVGTQPLRKEYNSAMGMPSVQEWSRVLKIFQADVPLSYP